MNIKYDMFLLLALMGTASAGAQNKKAAKPKAKTTAVKPAMSAHAKALFDEMLPNTQKIFVIDSMVVSKDNILEAIPLPATYGRMEKTADFFNNPAKEDMPLSTDSATNATTRRWARTASHAFTCRRRWATSGANAFPLKR